jgi:hypothetical protein
MSKIPNIRVDRVAQVVEFLPSKKIGGQLGLHKRIPVHPKLYSETLSQKQT